MGPERIHGPVQVRTEARPASRTSPGAFAAILEAEQQKIAPDLRVSAHAALRLREAGRTLSQQEVALVQAAMDKARAKGARESLIIMKDMALVVSVQNNTVITAVTGQRCKENVFTNIDSAVIVDGLDLREGAPGHLYQNGPTARLGGQ